MHLVALILVASLSAACVAEEVGSFSEQLMAGDADPYDPIKYQNCIGYQGEGSLDAGVVTCSASADCAGKCGALGANEACSCDKSCGCCFKEDLKMPGPNKEVCRFSWSACPDDKGTPCSPSYTADNQYTWFSNECGYTKPSEAKDKLCMMHIPDPPSSGGQAKGCLYKTTSPGKNCSRPSTGGAGAYECGNKTCAGIPSFQCNPGPTGKFDYTLVSDTCKES